jgi:hypothetical protein
MARARLWPTAVAVDGAKCNEEQCDGDGGPGENAPSAVRVESSCTSSTVPLS